MICTLSEAVNSRVSFRFLSVSPPTSSLHMSCWLCLQNSDLTTSYHLGCHPRSPDTCSHFLFGLPTSTITSLESIFHVAARVMVSKIQIMSKSDHVTSLLESCQCYLLTLEHNTNFLLLLLRPYYVVLV